MNRAQKFILLLEAVLNPKKMDYKKEYYGPLHVGIFSHKEHTPLYFKQFNTVSKVNDEKDSVQPVHDQLKQEAGEQFEKEHQGNHDQEENLSNVVSRYTHSAYESMNDHLRHGHNASEDTKDNIAKLKKLTKHRTKHNFTVYRGSKSPVVNPKKGEMFQDHGFTSTSLMPHMVEQNFNNTEDYRQGDNQLYRIRIRKGTKGHYVSGHDSSLNNGEEREFLLHPGTKFKVGKTVVGPTGKSYINLHIHSQEPDSTEQDDERLKPFDIEKDSPNENHKFILNHFKNHEKLSDAALKIEHKYLSKVSSDQLNNHVQMIKKYHPEKYGYSADKNQHKTLDTEKTFDSDEWKNAFGENKQN